MDHPENILLCAIKYEERDYSKFALEKILLVLKDNQPILVRSFHPPLINFEAENYLNLICWVTAQITKPPLLSDISDENLSKGAIEGNLHIPLLPSNTQAVERTVKVITELSLQASSYE